MRRNPESLLTDTGWRRAPFGRNALALWLAPASGLQVQLLLLLDDLCSTAGSVALRPVEPEGARRARTA